MYQSKIDTYCHLQFQMNELHNSTESFDEKNLKGSDYIDSVRDTINDMNLDMDMCIPYELSGFLKKSIVFWVCLVLVIIASAFASNAYHRAALHYKSNFPMSQSILMWIFVITLILGAIIPAVVADLHGSKSQRKCVAIAFIVLIIALVAGSLSFEYMMPYYGLFAYILCVIMLSWLGFLGFKSSDTMSSHFSGYLVVLPIVALLGFGIMMVRFDTDNSGTENLNKMIGV